MPEAPYQTSSMDHVSTQETTHSPGHDEAGWVSPAPTKMGARGRIIVAGAAGLLIAVTAYYFVQQSATMSALVATTSEEATPSVSLVSPVHGPATRSLTLPGDVHAWFQAPIFGQVSGYVRMWYKDIGAPVKQGDLLAVIDTPGLDQQLDQAKAQLEVAQANYALAQVTAERWQKLSGTQAVAQQDVDVKRADAQAQKAQVDAAKYNVARFEAMEGFKNIVAPFDGVVTARRTDVGDYVTGGGGDAGTTGHGQELFSVADIHAMRVYVSVPQDYSNDLKPGVTATLTLPQLPGRSFRAHDLSTARAEDTVSRTVLTQLVVDNPKDEILPGAYTNVKFELPSDPSILIVPEQALLFREKGMQVAVVGTDNKVHLQDVTLGRNFGATVQVTSGLKPADRLVANPSQGLLESETVRVVTVPPQNANNQANMAAISRQQSPHVERSLSQ
jgi:membrane fusion protein (multidrug efflux system)